MAYRSHYLPNDMSSLLPNDMSSLAYFTAPPRTGSSA
jgi:hypothetical protein